MMLTAKLIIYLMGDDVELFRDSLIQVAIIYSNLLISYLQLLKSFCQKIYITLN